MDFQSMPNRQGGQGNPTRRTLDVGTGRLRHICYLLIETKTSLMCLPPSPHFNPCFKHLPTFCMFTWCPTALWPPTKQNIWWPGIWQPGLEVMAGVGWQSRGKPDQRSGIGRQVTDMGKVSMHLVTFSVAMIVRWWSDYSNCVGGEGECAACNFCSQSW